MPLSLRQIHLENFRVFKKLEFSFAPLTILTGPNSSGKSSIVKALLLLQDNLEKYQLGQLDFTNSDHQLGSFDSVKTKGTADSAPIIFELEYEVTKSNLKFKDPFFKMLLSYNANEELIAIDGKNRLMGNITTFELIHANDKEKLVTISLSETKEYTLYINLPIFVANMLNARNGLSLRPSMNLVRDAIKIETFENHFEQLKAQYENEYEQKIQDIEQDSYENFYEREDIHELRNNKVEIFATYGERIASEQNKLNAFTQTLRQEKKDKIAEIEQTELDKGKTLADIMEKRRDLDDLHEMECENAKKDTAERYSNLKQSNQAIKDIEDVFKLNLERDLATILEDTTLSAVEKNQQLNEKFSELKRQKEQDINPILEGLDKQFQVEIEMHEETKLMAKNADEYQNLLTDITRIEQELDGLSQQKNDIEASYDKDIDDLQMPIRRLEQERDHQIEAIDVRIEQLRDQEIDEQKTIARQDKQEKIKGLESGQYYTKIYNGIIDYCKNILTQIEPYKVSGNFEKYPDLISFLTFYEWKAGLQNTNLATITIGDVLKGKEELSFLESEEAWNISLSEIIAGGDIDQIANSLLEEIKSLLATFLYPPLPFVHIKGIRGAQQRFYTSNGTSDLDKSINLLLTLQNQKDKEKLDFIHEWLPKFGIDGTIEAQQIDGSYITATIDGRYIADLGLGISQLLPIIITTAYHLGEGTLVAIEEPESHLHPKLQSTLADFMVAAIGKDVRFLVETHSVYFIRKIEVLLASKKLSSNDLRVCYIKKNENDGTKDRQVIDIDTNEDGLNAESTADLWSDFYDEAERLTQEKQMLQKFKNELGLTTKCLVLTEDQKHVEYPYLMILLKSCGFKEEEVKIVWYGNCDKMDIGIGMAKYAESIPTIQKIIFHRDADGLHQNHEEKIKGMLKHNNIKKGVPFVTYYNSIEGYFVNPEHILALFANLPEQELKEKINCAITALKIEDLKRLKQKYYDEEAAELKYEREPLKYCNTKELIKKINVILQVYAREGIISANPTLLQTSSKLIDEHLIQIAQQIWGNPE